MATTAVVYHGVWKNHATGDWTLTLSNRQAGMLSAAIVIFVGFVAAQAWNIARFVLHQALSAQKPHDGYRHNLRTILRNSDGHTAALWLSFRLALGWKKRLGFSKALAKGSMVTLLALVFVVASALIRLYISLIWTTNGDQVLVKNAQCGAVSISPDTVENIQTWAVYWADRLETAATYERQCYANSTDSIACSRLPVPRLNWTTTDASCPFTDESLCITNNSVPVTMDTGYINTNTHLGMNADDDDALEYRKVVTCSPMSNDYWDLVTVNRTATVTDNVLEMYYGPAAGSPQTFNYSMASLRYVYGYSLTALGYDPAGTDNQWFTNASITSRADATASIFFLASNYLISLAPVVDPWFRADPADWTSAEIPDPYVAPSPVTVLGCLEQHQICASSPSLSSSSSSSSSSSTTTTPASSRSRRCTPLTANRGIPDALIPLNLGARQLAAAAHLASAALTHNPDLSFVARQMPGDALLADKSAVGGTQYADLPADQWRREVARWFGVSLALLQEGVVEFVTGPTDAAAARHVLRLDGDDGDDGDGDDDAVAAARQECGAQRVRGGGAGSTNFNVVGIVVVAVVGCAVVAVGLVLDAAAGWCQARFRVWEYARLQWVLDGLFQQQRLAFEGAGVRRWADADSYVPTSGEAEWPMIDGIDRARPRLRHKGDGLALETPVEDGGERVFAPKA